MIAPTFGDIRVPAIPSDQGGRGFARRLFDCSSVRKLLSELEAAKGREANQ